LSAIRSDAAYYNNGMSGKWDPNSLNETFIRRGKEARLRQKECEAKAMSSNFYQRFADEAAARVSVYDYLDGKSFLESQDALLRAIRELAATEPPNLELFDRVNFVQARHSTINELLSEFSH
jgi:hypothetical protein